MPQGHEFGLEQPKMGKLFVTCSCGWERRYRPHGDGAREMWHAHLRKQRVPLYHDDPVMWNNDNGDLLVRYCDCGWESYPTKDSDIMWRQFQTHQAMMKVSS